MRYLRIYSAIAFLICFSVNLSGQTYQVFKGDTINRLDAKGQKQGLWRKYYPTDTLFSEGWYKNNIHTGIFTSYHKNGKVQSRLIYRGLTDICNAEIFSDEAKLIAKGKYIDKTRDSLWSFYNKEGGIASVEFYQKGKREGSWKVYFPNGQVSHLTTYKADKKHGPYKEFYEGGTPKVEGMMKSNEFDGILTMFFENGKVWQKGKYQNGLREGSWMIFKETGEKEREDLYKAGKLLNPLPEE
ncbi:MAG TPA: toxin-antitoxin system YwqK family antitoxin [Bacteroidia bacterium]|nr:toxin-antitoxin system YwqK family antitoxin [Bacteroidia bacterium]